MTNATKMTLLQRLNEVRKQNEYIKKDKRVGEGGYMAVTHDAVTSELRKDLLEQGVLVLPSVVQGTEKVVPTGTFTSKNVPFIRFEAVFSVAFVNVDDAKDREVVLIPVHAVDQGDKAPGKAISYATKYAMLKVFNIETGEDDEGRNPTEHGGNPMPEKEIADWKAAIDVVADKAAAEKLWKKIIEALNKYEDTRTMTVLRAHFGATMKKKGIGAAKNQQPAKDAA